MDDATNPQAEHCAMFTGSSYPDDRPYEAPPSLFGLSLFNGAVNMVGDSIAGSPI